MYLVKKPAFVNLNDIKVIFTSNTNVRENLPFKSTFENGLPAKSANSRSRGL